MAQRELFRTQITRDELNSLVDRAADLIRTAVDYKFILVLLFLKRLNDLRKADKLLETFWSKSLHKGLPPVLKYQPDFRIYDLRQLTRDKRIRLATS